MFLLLIKVFRFALRCCVSFPFPPTLNWILSQGLPSDWLEQIFFTDFKGSQLSGEISCPMPFPFERSRNIQLGGGMHLKIADHEDYRLFWSPDPELESVRGHVTEEKNAFIHSLNSPGINLQCHSECWRCSGFLNWTDGKRAGLVWL